jgi:hypothetical protein
VFTGAGGFVSCRSDTWSIQWKDRDWYMVQESRPDSLAIGPRDTFGIVVAKDGFDTVRGRTVVPDTFSILFPREGDTVSMSDSMVWTRSRTCAGYYMSFRQVEGQDTFYFDMAVSNDSLGPNYDSLRVRMPQMLFLYREPAGPYTIRIYALDTNYFDWVSAGGFGPGAGGGETTHVQGGLGVFGSAVERSVAVYVRPDTMFGQQPKSE